MQPSCLVVDERKQRADGNERFEVERRVAEVMVPVGGDPLSKLAGQGGYVGDMERRHSSIDRETYQLYNDGRSWQVIVSYFLHVFFVHFTYSCYFCYFVLFFLFLRSSSGNSQR